MTFNELKRAQRELLPDLDQTRIGWDQRLQNLIDAASKAGAEDARAGADLDNKFADLAGTAGLPPAVVKLVERGAEVGAQRERAAVVKYLEDLHTLLTGEANYLVGNLRDLIEQGRHVGA